MKRLYFLCFAMIIAVAPAVMAAEPGVHDPSIPGTPHSVATLNDQWAKKHNLMFHLGVSHPSGYMGLEYAYDLLPSLQLAISGGLGRGDAQVAGMVRWRYHTEGALFVHLGVGVSLGETLESINVEYRPDGEEFAVRPGYYGNIEAAVGWRYRSGFQLYWTLGLSWLVNADDAECIENCYHTSAGGTSVYTREEADIAKLYLYAALNLGYTF